MKKFKAQFRRLVFIHREILDGTRTGRLPNSRTITEKWRKRNENINPRTVQRDISYMKYDLNAPIEYSRKGHGYYYTDPSYTLPMLNLAKGEVFAIYLADKVLTQYQNTPLYHTLENIFKKLSDGLPGKVTIDPAWLDPRLSFIPEPAPEILPGVWKAVFKALLGNKTLDMEYLTPGDANTKHRQVDPYHVFGFKGEWYIAGYCHLRKETRTFALSRIRSARVTSTHFPEHSFDFDRFIGDHFGVFRGQKACKVRVRFTGKCATYARERQWHPQQTVTLDKGDTIVEFETVHTLEAMRWVLSWGGCAKVEGDASFLDMVKAELKKAADIYGI